MLEHSGGAPSATAAVAMHPCLCCVFVILLPRVPGRARSVVCDGPELRHRQTDRRNEFIYKIMGARG